MKINIDTPAIQDAIIKAITESTIGEAIKKAIEKGLSEKTGYNSKTIIENACETEITRIVGILIREELEKRKEDFKKIVSPLITDKIIDEMGHAVLNIMLNKLEKNNY